MSASSSLIEIKVPDIGDFDEVTVIEWLVKPGDAEAWAEALSNACEAGAARRQIMGMAARARARKLYSVDAMVEATLKVYARVLETKS